MNWFILVTFGKQCLLLWQGEKTFVGVVCVDVNMMISLDDISKDNGFEDFENSVRCF